MFARVFTKFFKRGSAVSKEEEARKGSASPFGRGTAAPAPTPASSPPTTAGQDGSGSAAEAVKKEWESKAAQTIRKGTAAEELCGINAGMSREEISEKLARLYRRHNRAAASLDEKLREEAEIMLEAIAGLKEKYLR